MEKKNSDFVIMECLDLTTSNQEGYDLKAVSAIFQKHPGVLFSHKDSEIETPEDFIGKKIGIKGMNWDNIVETLLESVGLSYEDVIKFNISDDMNLFYNREIDVWNGYAWDEPIEAELAGYPVNLIYASDYGVGNYAGVIATRTELVGNNPDLVEKFVRASLQGWKYAIDNPEIAAHYAVDRNSELTLDHQKLAMGYLHPMIFYDSRIGCLNKERLSGYEYAYDDVFVEKACTEIIYPPVTEKNFWWFVIGTISVLLIPLFWIWFISIRRGGKKK